MPEYEHNDQCAKNLCIDLLISKGLEAHNLQDIEYMPVIVSNFGFDSSDLDLMS